MQVQQLKTSDETCPIPLKYDEYESPFGAYARLGTDPFRMNEHMLMWFFDETPYDRIFVKGPYSFYLAEAVAKLLAMKEIPSDFDLKSLYCAPTHLVLQKKKDAASGRRGKYGVELVKHEGNASLNFERKDVGTMRDGHFLIYVRFPSTASLLRLAELFLLSHSILYRAP